MSNHDTQTGTADAIKNATPPTSESNPNPNPNPNPNVASLPTGEKIELAQTWVMLRNFR
ncbi:MAG: hypothetical protein IT215_00645 [Chitinophagaceae bacterium]|nr:hypothetical protein [Chitinophagaceae bacterium]